MYYKRDFIDRVRQADILPCFPEKVKRGNRYQCNCPGCNHQLGMELYYDRSRRRYLGKCFHCGLFIPNPIEAVKAINGWNQAADFARAIEEAARICNVYCYE